MSDDIKSLYAVQGGNLGSLDESHADTVHHNKLRNAKKERVSIVTMVVPSVMKKSQFVYISIFYSKMSDNYGLLGYRAV